MNWRTDRPGLILELLFDTVPVVPVLDATGDRDRAFVFILRGPNLLLDFVLIVFRTSDFHLGANPVVKDEIPAVPPTFAWKVDMAPLPAKNIREAFVEIIAQLPFGLVRLRECQASTRSNVPWQS